MGFERLVFVSGQGATDPATGKLAGEDTAAQTEQCLKNVRTILRAAGSDLQFDVRAYSAGFSSASNSSPLDAGGNLPALTTFNVGNACDVVLVRAFYKWPVFTPGLRYFLANVTGGYHLVSSAAAFRNEPFTTTTGGC